MQTGLVTFFTQPYKTEPQLFLRKYCGSVYIIFGDKV